MSRREFLKRALVGVVASLALFIAGCGEGGGEQENEGEQENGGENNGGEEEDGGGGY